MNNSAKLRYLLNNILVLIVFFLCSHIKTNAQCLSGIYTIGGASPNYPTLAAAKNALVLNGVCGPVVFNIRSGIYTERVVLPSIVGSSAINSITFQSEVLDSNLVIVRYPFTSTNYTNNTVFTITGSNYIIRKMTLRCASGSNYNGNLIDVSGQKNSFISNKMVGNPSISIIAINVVNTNSVIISQNKIDTTTAAFQIEGSDHLIQNNRLFNNGSSITTGTNAPFSNSLVKGNDIKDQNSPYYLSANCRLNKSRNIRLTENSFKLNGYYSTSAISITGLADNVVFDNNYVELYASNQYSSVMYIQPNLMDSIFILNNTFRQTSSGATSAYLLNINMGKVKLFNNLLINEVSGNLLYKSTNALFSSDYNCFYTQSGYLTYDAATLTLYKTLYSSDYHSIYKKPQFNPVIPYKMLWNYDIDNKGIFDAAYSSDIENNLRDAVRPDIGCYETIIQNDDAGIQKIISPDSILCSSGSNNVLVRLRNYGNNTLTSATINWKFNQQAINSFLWTGNLLPNDSADVLVGVISTVPSFGSRVKAWTKLPNGITDSFNFNDTVSTGLIRAGLGGVYTIGGATP